MTARRKPRLAVVKEPPADITALLRAEIRRRDWAHVHITGDRREALFLPERPRRTWR